MATYEIMGHIYWNEIQKSQEKVENRSIEITLGRTIRYVAHHNKLLLAPYGKSIGSNISAIIGRMIRTPYPSFAWLANPKVDVSEFPFVIQAQIARHLKNPFG